MRFYLQTFFITLALLNSANALANCQDLQVISKAAELAIADYEKSTPEDDCLMCGYLLVEEPTLEKANVKGNDVWNVPVVGDGEGCYGDVYVTVKAGTCTIVETPEFNGVSCTDE